MLENLVPIASFVVSGTVSPGPNNVMLTASGVNFGFRRTLPHMVGITLGFPAMVIAVGLGMGGLFAAVPALHQALKVFGFAYILYLAWRIATASAGPEAAEGKAPFTLLQAAAFQWVNPKAWLMAVGAVSAFTTTEGDFLLEVLAIAALFALVTAPSVALWTLFGAAIGRSLARPLIRRLFNGAMAMLLLVSALPLVL